jgi:hypothetical protein
MERAVARSTRFSDCISNGDRVRVSSEDKPHFAIPL